MEAVPASIAELVARELEGEEVLWSDRPDPYAILQRSVPGALVGLLPILFGLMVLSSVGEDSGRYTRLIGQLGSAFFIVAGVAILINPFIAQAEAESTLYVVTARRALVIGPSGPVRVRSFDGTGAARFERRQRGEGGDIVLGREVQVTKRSHRLVDRGFFGLRDFAGADAALVALAERSAATRASADVTGEEGVLWRGHAHPGLAFRSLLFFFLFLVVWFAFAFGVAAWSFTQPDPEKRGLGALLLVFHVPAGIYVLAQCLRQLRRERSAAYVVTTQRASVTQLGEIVKSYNSGEVAGFARHSRRDGSGGIGFARAQDGTATGPPVHEVWFMHLADTREAEQALAALARSETAV